MTRRLSSLGLGVTALCVPILHYYNYSWGIYELLYKWMGAK